jgi:hypothetical protein
MEEGVVLLGVAVAVGLIARDMLRTKRQRACPVCGKHDLIVVSWHRWHGERTGGARTEYRCRDCGEPLFAELSTPVMTRAQHEAWLEAMIHRDTHEPPPPARVHRRRRWWW